jgi:hypothetical protein
MKKTLLTCALLVSSCFFVSAQFQIGDLKLNVGRVCKTISGQQVCINPSTGQWDVVDSKGRGVGVNVNTGAVSGAGTIDGTRVGFQGSVAIPGAGTIVGGTAIGADCSSIGSKQECGTGGLVCIAYKCQRVGTGANGQGYSGLLGLLALAQTIVARLVPFLVGVALLAFFWFLIEFIWKGKDNPDKQKEGKTGMAYSLVALFVMVSVWGIIAFAGAALGINQGGNISGFNLPGE